MLEAGLDLLRPVFVHVIVIKPGNDEAVDFGCGIEEPVGLYVKYATGARARRRLGGNDVPPGNPLKNIGTHNIASQ